MKGKPTEKIKSIVYDDKLISMNLFIKKGIKY